MSVDYVKVGELEEVIEVAFHDPRLLMEALTHRSWCNENRNQGGKHNERLEFLGDAVLELCVTKFLMEAFPDSTEADMTLVRSALVRNDSLALVASELDLMSHLRMSRGEAKNCNSQSRQRIAACLVEALVGAIYLDQGFESAWRFVQEHVIASLAHILENSGARDPKSQLQELVQAQLGVTPEYRKLLSSGPEHLPVHVAGVIVNGELWGQGGGRSVRRAQMAAAQQALATHFGESADAPIVLPESVPEKSQPTQTARTIPALAFLGRSETFRTLSKDTQRTMAEELAG